MAFNPDGLGLAGERISGYFMEPRPNGCPHKGMDISSSGVAKPFTAGVHGRVVSPIATPYGTISVSPFNDPTALIQYLHCSSYEVQVGDIVAPWTVLGKTGNTAPPGTGITGIHLHIQVIERGNPSQSCWDRNYVDPFLWNTGIPIIGRWVATRSGQTSTGGWNWTAERVIETDRIGTVITSFIRMHYYWNNGCWVTNEGEFKSTVTQYTKNGLYTSNSPGTCRASSNCSNAQCNPTDGGPAEWILIEPDKLQIRFFQDNTTGIYTRKSAITNEVPDSNLNTLPTSKHIVFDISANPYIDVNLLDAYINNVSAEEYYGVLPDETF